MLKILPIMSEYNLYGLILGILVISAITMTNCAGDPGGFTGVHDTVALDLLKARVPSCFL